MVDDDVIYEDFTFQDCWFPEVMSYSHDSSRLKAASGCRTGLQASPLAHRD